LGGSFKPIGRKGRESALERYYRSPADARGHGACTRPPREFFMRLGQGQAVAFSQRGPQGAEAVETDFLGHLDHHRFGNPDFGGNDLKQRVLIHRALVGKRRDDARFKRR